MSKITEIKFSEFSELSKFLNDGDNGSLLLERLSRFFPNANASEIFDISYAAELAASDDPNAERAYAAMLENCADVEVDPTGMSEAHAPKDGWRITLRTMDTIYRNAENMLKESNYSDSSKHKVNSQAYNAMNLFNMANAEYNEKYDIAKASFFLKTKDLEISSIVNRKSLSEAEKVLESFGLDKRILSRFLDICGKKKYENCQMFARHFLERLRLLSEDSELSEESSRKFLENLKKISEKSPS